MRLGCCDPAHAPGRCVVTLTLVDHLGPITTEVSSSRFWFIPRATWAAQPLIVIVSLRTGHADAGGAFGGWGMTGSTIMLVAAVSAALWVQNIVPLLDQVGEVPAGWLVL